MSEPIEVYCTNANSERGPDLLFLPHVTHIPIFRQQWEKNKSDLYSTTSTLVTTVYDNLHRTSSAYVLCLRHHSPWMKFLLSKRRISIGRSVDTAVDTLWISCPKFLMLERPQRFDKTRRTICNALLIVVGCVFFFCCSSVAAAQNQELMTLSGGGRGL